MQRQLQYLLLQTRNLDDAMRRQEVECFARALECDPADIAVVDFLSRAPTKLEVDAADVVLLGGSGHYSAAREDEWLVRSFDTLRELHHRAKPTFASCWGFQAMAQALGGRCIHDLRHAELGTIELSLTDAGVSDPLFSLLPRSFNAQAGHEDYVVEIPAEAVLLASSDRVTNQAFRFSGKPIYCTQFHPELDRTGMLERIRAYPEYVQRIAGMSYDNFVECCRETPEVEGLLPKFVRLVFGD